MWQKGMDREATKQIRETRRKEKQDMQARKATTIMIVAIAFIVAWSFATIKETRNKHFKIVWHMIKKRTCSKFVASNKSSQR